MSFRAKIVQLDDLQAWRARQRTAGHTVVATNGCFDLLHVGHISYLEKAKGLGQLLLIGLNSDESVRALKGPSRPVVGENDRAVVLAALELVDAVCVFNEPQATRFLSLAKPDIYVKGGDYTVDTLNQEERRAVESAGGRIVILPFVPGKSTTALLNKLG